MGTRYRPVKVGGITIQSAAEKRRADAELLCERLPQRFINHLRIWEPEQIQVLEMLADLVFAATIVPAQRRRHLANLRQIATAAVGGAR